MRILEKQMISIILIMCLLCSYVAPLISVAVDTKTNENEISLVEEFKSKLYENYYSNKANDFKYVVKKNIDISNQSNIVQVKLEDDIDSLLLDEDRISLENSIYYNFCLISVKSFNNIFGEDGLITFFDNYGNEIGAIHADKNKAEDEYYIFKFERKYDKVSYQISKPVNEGTLELIVQKTMKSSVTRAISYEDFRNIQKLITNTKISYEFTEAEEVETEIEEEIEDGKETEKKSDDEEINIGTKDKFGNISSRSEALDMEQDEADIDLEQNDELNNEENEEALEKAETKNSTQKETQAQPEKVEVIKETEQQDIVDEVELKEPLSQINLSLSENTIYTLDENKVEFTLVLKNSSYENELFKDPVIDIGLPEEITDAKIDKVLVLYKNGLSISKWEVIERENSKHLYLELDGEQTEYLNSEIIDGTTIIIETTLKTAETTPIKESNVKLMYENSDRKIDYKEEDKDGKDYELNFMSKYGLLLLSGIENESKEDSKKLAIGDNLKTIDLDIEAESQKLNYEMTVVNNYTESLKNVEIIGSLPVENNEKLLEQDLKNTFTSNLLTTIGTSGVENTVYYSNESNPSKDSKSWTENYEELESIASYKIVMNEFNAGDVLNFNYESNIPEDLTYNQAIYSQYNVNYNIDGIDYVATSTVGAKTETKEITYEDCQTQESVGSLDVGVYASKGGKQLEEGQDVHNGQFIDYTVVLTNNTDEVIENIELESSLVNGNFYELRALTEDEVQTANFEDDVYTVYFENTEKEKDNQNIEKLEPGQQVIYSFESMIVRENDSNITKSNYILKIGEEEFDFSSIENKIIDSKLNIRVEYGGTENAVIATDGTMRISVIVGNYSIEDISDVDFEFWATKDFVLNEEFSKSYKENFKITNVEEYDNYNVYKFKINELPKEYMDSYVFLGKTSDLDYDKVEKEYDFIVKAYYQNEIYLSNHYKRMVYQRYTTFESEFQSDHESNSYVDNGDEITYFVNVKNTGIIDSNTNVLVVLPDGLDLEEYKLFKNGELVEEDNTYSYKVNTNIDISTSDVIMLQIKAKVNYDKLLYSQESLNVFAEISSNTIPKKITTNEIGLYVDNPNIVYDPIEDEEEIIEQTKEEIVDESMSLDELEQIKLDLGLDNNEEIKENTNEATEEIEENNESDNVSENVVPDNQTNTDNNSSSNEESKETNNTNNATSNKGNETVKVTYTNTETVNSTNTNNKSTNKTQSTTGSSAVESTKGTNNIKGTVWIDTNKNGLKDSTEKLQQGITVKLYKTSELTSTENYVEKTTTNNKGEYTFNSLEDGTYIVVFEFDTDKYTITQYSVNSTELGNSNVISKNVNNKEYAVSNSIILGASNTINVNFGLAERANFDLKIDKKISSVKIENGKDDRTTNYNNESLIKEEITAKYLAGTKVTITYNIKVTNTGDMAGYANEIKDYLPKELEFNKELNKDWILNNGELVNNSLTNTEIKPGEIKELKLVLTKTMTEDNTGTVTNKAGITINSNSKNVQDADTKNDTSEMTIILSVKTGGVIIISVIALVVLAIIGSGVWLIKFKVMR